MTENVTVSARHDAMRQLAAVWSKTSTPQASEASARILSTLATEAGAPSA